MHAHPGGYVRLPELPEHRSPISMSRATETERGRERDIVCILSKGFETNIMVLSVLDLSRVA